jgi:hypothetical protein
MYNYTSYTVIINEELTERLLEIGLKDFLYE